MGNSTGREFPLVFGGFCGGKCVDVTFLSSNPVSGTLHSQRKSSNGTKKERNNWLRQRSLEIIPVPRAWSGIKGLWNCPLKEDKYLFWGMSHTPNELGRIPLMKRLNPA